MEKADALVLRVVAWSETSSIVTLYTREFGRVRATAKGARRPKGPFASALDLLSKCRVVFVRKSSDALDLLTEARLARCFRPQLRGLRALYAGYHVAEVLQELSDDYDPHPALFDAADAALARLGSVYDRAALAELPPATAETLRFELTALRELGYLPVLEECVECGRSPDHGERIAFGQLSGGVLCRACRPGKRQVTSLSREAWQTLRLYARPGDEWMQFAPQRAVQAELRGLMGRYFAGLTGQRLRTSEYLETY